MTQCFVCLCVCVYVCMYPNNLQLLWRAISLSHPQAYPLRITAILNLVHAFCFIVLSQVSVFLTQYII